MDIFNGLLLTQKHFSSLEVVVENIQLKKVHILKILNIFQGMTLELATLKFDYKLKNEE